MSKPLNFTEQLDEIQCLVAIGSQPIVIEVMFRKNIWGIMNYGGLRNDCREGFR